MTDYKEEKLLVAGRHRTSAVNSGAIKALTRWDFSSYPESYPCGTRAGLGTRVIRGEMRCKPAIAAEKIGEPGRAMTISPTVTRVGSHSLRAGDGQCRFASMSVSLKSLGIDRLGVEERIALVEEIWDNTAADSAAVPLTTPQRG